MKQKIKTLYLESEFDENCSQDFVDILAPRFFSYFFNCGANSHDAEDYCQELFITLFKSRATFDPNRGFLPWAYRIARNLYIRENSKKGRVNIISLQEYVSDNNAKIGVETFEKASDDKSVIQNFLDRLSPEKKKVLVLKHFHGLKFWEIAKLLNISEGTAKTRVFYALQELKKIAEDMKL